MVRRSQRNRASSQESYYPKEPSLTKLYALLKDPALHQCIRWDSRGENIVLLNPKQLELHGFLGNISFYNQLNRHGFVRQKTDSAIVEDSGAIIYSHPTLNRDSPAEVVANFPAPRSHKTSPMEADEALMPFEPELQSLKIMARYKPGTLSSEHKHKHGDASTSTSVTPLRWISDHAPAAHATPKAERLYQSATVAVAPSKRPDSKRVHAPLPEKRIVEVQHFAQIVSRTRARRDRVSGTVSRSSATAMDPTSSVSSSSSQYSDVIAPQQPQENLKASSENLDCHFTKEVTALLKEYFNKVSSVPTTDQCAALLDEIRKLPGMEDFKYESVKRWFQRRPRRRRRRVGPTAVAVPLSQQQYNPAYPSLTPDVLQNLHDVWTAVPANKRHHLHDHWTNIAYADAGADPDDVAHWLLDRQQADAGAG
ncbi:hypothetical protein GGX14DRAFT_573437 [Mycena pura]|uniref:Homeobox domain-containing protein n=1 Tax=Mycena pura TaxID=153505 RepID=A0AAD6V6L2_9AGAR|nr:hypothetical protein GGX14DRAFT_573437 [Mycena pura]